MDVNILNDQEMVKHLDDELDERDPLEELAIEIGSPEITDLDESELEESFQIKSIDDNDDDLL